MLVEGRSWVGGVGGSVVFGTVHRVVDERELGVRGEWLGPPDLEDVGR